MNDHTEYSGDTGGQICFDAYADYKQAWNERGGEQPEAMMTLPRNVAILSPEGEVLFRITEEGSESFREDIYQIPVTDLDSGEEETVLLSLPAGNYLVRSEDPQRESLWVRFTHTAQSISVRADAPEIGILADDRAMCVSVCIPQTGRSYSIELDAIMEEDSRVVLLEGSTGENGLRFGCFNGTLQAEGSLTEENASLYIDEEPVDLDCVERVRSDASSQQENTQRIRMPLTNSDSSDTAQ